MQITPAAPIGATSFALPLTFAELLDLDEQAREVAAALRLSVEDARETLRARILYMPDRPWTEILARRDETRAFLDSIAGDL